MSEEFRKKILAEVAAFYQSYHQPRQTAAFSPGQSRIHYAGRVFDQAELVNAVDSALDFYLTANRYTEQFEDRLAQYFGVESALFVNSGSSANLIALSALTSPKLKDRRLMPGDEVITVAAGFPTTVAPILQNQLVPVFVDIGIGDYTAVPEQIEAAIGSRTRAIMMAHTLGNPFDLGVVMKLAEKHRLWVIEDNCDALGSTYHGKLTGTFGHFATCSFYPAHHITTGEGGAVITNDPELARIAASFRDWGRDCYCVGGENNTCGKRFSQQFGDLPYGFDHKYVYTHIGYNLKATDLQAAIGCAQLDKLSSFIERRKRNWQTLRNLLNTFEDRLILPRATPGADPSWFGFVMTVREDAGFSRNDITAYLESAGVETRTVFAGNLLRHPAFLQAPRRVVGTLENTDRVMMNSFFIGVYPGLNDEHLDYVRSVVARFLETR